MRAVGDDGMHVLVFQRAGQVEALEEGQFREKKAQINDPQGGAMTQIEAPQSEGCGITIELCE